MSYENSEDMLLQNINLALLYKREKTYLAAVDKHLIEIQVQLKNPKASELWQTMNVYFQTVKEKSLNTIQKLENALEKIQIEENKDKERFWETNKHFFAHKQQTHTSTISSNTNSTSLTINNSITLG